jgi:ribosomal protein L29
MKKKELNELRQKDVKQLEKMLDENKLELLKTKANIAVAKEKNLKKAKNLRKEISQIETVLKEKEQIAESSNNKEQSV